MPPQVPGVKRNQAHFWPLRLAPPVWSRVLGNFELAKRVLGAYTLPLILDAGYMILVPRLLGLGAGGARITSIEKRELGHV